MSFFTLLAIALVLITLEVFIYSFVVFWFGLGFLIVSFVEFIYPMNDVILQLCFVVIFSFLFLILFRKKFLNKFSKGQKIIKDDFLNDSGYGEVKNGKIFFKGTFWEFEGNLDEKEFKDGEKVFVEKTKNNIAYIKSRD